MRDTIFLQLYTKRGREGKEIEVRVLKINPMTRYSPDLVIESDLTQQKWIYNYVKIIVHTTRF